MARIRSIKPEFFTSEQIAECSPSARLLFVGLWVFSDCGGVHPASPKRLKMEVFPADSITTGEVAAMVAELIAAGLVVYFEREDQGFWAVTGWRHQKIDKPTLRHPQPTLDELSATPRRMVAEESPSAQRVLPPGSGRDVDRDRIKERNSAVEGGTGGRPVAARKKPARTRPDDFAPNETDRRVAKECGVNLETEFPKFCDFHDGKGSVFADWHAALRTWIRNVRAFAPRSAPARVTELPGSERTHGTTGGGFRRAGDDSKLGTPSAARAQHGWCKAHPGRAAVSAAGLCSECRDAMLTDRGEAGDVH